jgi:uncharacterized ion transporter superfamily protein YfcC
MSKLMEAFYIFFAIVILLGVYKSVFPSKRKINSNSQDDEIQNQVFRDQQNIQNQMTQESSFDQSIIDQQNIQNQFTIDQQNFPNSNSIE